MSTNFDLFLTCLGWVSLVLAIAGTCYGAVAVRRVAHMLRSSPAKPQTVFPAITVLKPLHGIEPELQTALASFLEQDYLGAVQLVFGVQSNSDPAIAIVDDLRARFPERDMTVVVDSARHGTNPKVSSLINMMKVVKNDFIVLADADIKVPGNYLTLVATAASPPGIGAVSALYFGNGASNIWSKIVAMGTSYQFLPNAAFSITSGIVRPCFGSTIALKRDMLTRIGGFEAFANAFADDYEIGRAVQNTKFEIAYPAIAVQHNSFETSCSAAFAHELRWSRTIRTLNLAGHIGSIVTLPVPLAVASVFFLGFHPFIVVTALLLFAARLRQKLQIDRVLGVESGKMWLMPVRDFFSFAIFVSSFFGNTVEWRGERLRIGRTGAILEV